MKKLLLFCTLSVLLLVIPARADDRCPDVHPECNVTVNWLTENEYDIVVTYRDADWLYIQSPSYWWQVNCDGSPTTCVHDVNAYHQYVLHGNNNCSKSDAVWGISTNSWCAFNYALSDGKIFSIRRANTAGDLKVSMLSDNAAFNWSVSGSTGGRLIGEWLPVDHGGYASKFLDVSVTGLSGQENVTLNWAPDLTILHGIFRPCSDAEAQVEDDGVRDGYNKCYPDDDSCKSSCPISSSPNIPQFAPPVPNPPKGGECPAHPVSVESGYVTYTERDPIPVPVVGSLQRVYNSGDRYGTAFGYRWWSMFDGWFLPTDGSVAGEYVTFRKDGGATFVFRNVNGSFVRQYPQDAGGVTTLRYDGADLVYTDRNQQREWVFDGSTRYLSVIRDLSTGRSIRIERDVNMRVTHVIDSWGVNSLTITTDPTLNRIVAISMDGQPGMLWRYEYDGAKNLNVVRAPNGNVWRTYENSDSYYAQGAALLAVKDTLGNVIERHDYVDSQKFRANTSYGPGGDLVNLERFLPGRVPYESASRLTWGTGQVETRYMRRIAGKRRTIELTGGCSSCGAGDYTRVMDSLARVTRFQDDHGWIAEYGYTGNSGKPTTVRTFLRPEGCDPTSDVAHCRRTYDQLDASNLEASALTRVTTYTYGDANWPENPTVVSEDSVFAPGQQRIQTFTFDPTTGVTLQASVTGWTGSPAHQETRTTVTTLYDGVATAEFNPGGLFDAAWMTLPQPSTLPRTVDGPRTDVSDVTRYVYYPNDSSVPAVLRSHLAAVKNAAGFVTRYEAYDLFGNATRVVDANGVIRESTTDALGRVLSQTTKGIPSCDTTADPLCGTDVTDQTAYVNGVGPVDTVTRAAGGVVKYGYDTRARVSAIKRGPATTDLREQTGIEYDVSSGKKSKDTFFAWENGAWVEKRSTWYEYDDQGRLKRTYYPPYLSPLTSGEYEEYTYYADGKLLGVKDARHPSSNTTYQYDGGGRLEKVWQLADAATGRMISTGYGYDAAGHLTSVTDAKTNTTSYLVDDFGQILQQTSPVTGVTSYTYDAGGNVLQTTDANGATTTRSYDVLGRVTTSTALKGSESESSSWTYDDPMSGSFGLGRLTSYTDPTGGTLLQYDRRGLLRTEAKSVGANTFISRYTYDASGNRNSMTYPSGSVAVYGFDWAGRATALSVNGTPVVSNATYAPFGPELTTTYGNSTSQSRTFDQRYRLQTNSLTGPSGAIANYSYGYDANANVAWIHDQLQPTYNRDFLYDDLNRLVTANTGSALWGAGSFSYDDTGNMTGASLGSYAGRSFEYVGTTSKLLAATENGARQSVTYDGAGNEVSTGYRNFTVSPRNYVMTGDGLTYGYDARGLRTTTTMTPTPGTVIGDVRSSVGGAPVAGATVGVTGTMNTTATDDAGGFSLTQEAGSLTLTVSKSGFSPKVTPWFTIPNGGVFNAGTISLDPYASVSGTVINSYDNARVDGAVVSAPGGYSATSGNGGQYSLQIPPGTFVLTATKAGYLDKSSQQFAIAAGASRTENFAMDPAAIPTSIEYSGNSYFTYRTVATLRARLLNSLGVPMPGRTLTFTVGTDSFAGVTGSDGTVTIQAKILSRPGSAQLSVRFAGESPYQASQYVTATSVSRAIPKIMYTGKTAIARGLPQTVSALMKAPDGTPIDALLSFYVVGTTVTGYGSASLLLPDTASTGGQPIQVSFAGDSYYEPTYKVVNGSVYEQTSFVIWDGNATHLKLGSVVKFFGSTWTQQVTSGDYKASTKFTGLPRTATMPITICEPTRTTTSNPPVDNGCWSGTGTPPSIVGNRIGVNVTRSMLKTATGDAGNTTARVVLSVSSYSTGTKGSGTGTVVDVIEDAIPSFAGLMYLQPTTMMAGGTVSVGARLVQAGARYPLPAGQAVTFSMAGASATGTTDEGGEAWTNMTLPASTPAGTYTMTVAFAGYAPSNEPACTITASVTVTAGQARSVGKDVAPLALGIVPDLLAPRSATLTSTTPSSRTYLYTPELHLMSETVESPTASPQVEYEYYWFNGRPVAQNDVQTGTMKWTFTDHLGTPILQTSAQGAEVWRVELEPYGNVYTFRSGDALHQPLRFPGQETEQFKDGQAPASDRSYNIFRWYRAGFGRYTQNDPAIAVYGFAYAFSNPARIADPNGLWGVRHAEDVQPSPNPELFCGSPIACSRVSARVACKCSCPNMANDPVRPEPTLVISGRILVNPAFKSRAAAKVDPNVKGYRSAVRHEYDFHVDRAIDAVSNIMTALEAETFGSPDACQARCSAVHTLVYNTFNDVLRETQLWEVEQANK